MRQAGRAHFDTGVNTIFYRDQLKEAGLDITAQRAYVIRRIGGMMREGFPVLIGGHIGCALGQDLMDD